MGRTVVLDRVLAADGWLGIQLGELTAGLDHFREANSRISWTPGISQLACVETEKFTADPDYACAIDSLLGSSLGC